jgi:hypothetical protein
MHGTSVAFEPEWTFLRAACCECNNEKKLSTLHALLRSPIRWKILFDLADRHGVLPLLAQSLFSVQECVPADELSALKQPYQANVHKTLLLSRELIRIVDHLAGLDIEVMPYKGLALAETVYGDIALRQAGDIDLLIHAHDFRRVRGAVSELGYVPHVRLSEAEEQAYLESGYECAFDGAAGNNLLEVQWAMQPRFYAVDFDMNGLFERAVTITVAGYPIKTPCMEDLFVVLALHAAKHVWARLIWLCDVARIMSRPDLNWQQIASRAREFGIVRILRITLILANRILDASIAAVAEESLPADPAALQLAEEIEARISSETVYDVESLAYFRLMLRLRERQYDQIRFLSRLIFTPGPSEWAVVRLPKLLFPLYRLVRISRLAARLVRV